eukprot:TRINITY_DN8591_c0_g1_i1.p1 TRINITY_DN8591_c0_g1~~TRINITY_DN8591_c0_g1_i1.p1  ORF type:complete len:207 (+),score=79.37 TRINITY_DN8591_c0_g1_i1:136-756(+)
MIRRPPRSTLSSSSAASDVYKRQGINAEYGSTLTQTMALELSDKEKKRGRKIFDEMDVNNDGVVQRSELSIVNETDQETMMKYLDADGNDGVDPAEWENYLFIKKQEKGRKKFTFFLNYLEEQCKKLAGSKQTASEAPAPAANESASSEAKAKGGERELKPEFKQAIEVFTPPGLGLRNSNIKDAFKNLMLAIQDLDAAVGAGKPE